MGFQTEGSTAMTVKIDHTNRDASGYSSLQAYLKLLKYLIDDEIRAEIEREWNTNHGDQRTGQVAFVENYLQERYGFRVYATPYDGERYPGKPDELARKSLRSYPFYRFTVRRGQGGLFPWTWERTELFPFNKIIVHPVSFDEFGFDSPWEFSGGATRPMAEDVLDAAPMRSDLMLPRPVPRKDGIIITVDIVDLAVGSDEVVATLEDHWGSNHFGMDEFLLNPDRPPLRDELKR